MKLNSVPMVICVTFLVILLGVNEIDALDASWLKIFDIFPQFCRTCFKLIFGLIWAYVTSERGNEVENVVDLFFQVFQSEVKTYTDVLVIPSGEVPMGKLGYGCWAAGKIVGLETLEAKPPKVSEDPDGLTSIRLVIAAPSMHLVMTRFASRAIGFQTLQGEFEIGLTDAQLTLEFKVKDVGNCKDFIMGVIQKQCPIQLTNIEFSHLKSFDVVPRDKKGHRTFTGWSIQKTSDAFAKGGFFLMQMLSNKFIRPQLYGMLPEKEGIACRSQELTKQVREYDPNIDKKLEKQKKRQAERMEEMKKKIEEMERKKEEEEEDEDENEDEEEEEEPKRKNLMQRDPNADFSPEFYDLCGENNTEDS